MIRHRFSTGDWNHQIRGEVLIHVSQFRQKLSTSHLGFIVSDNSLTCGRQASEGKSLFHQGFGSTGSITFNYGDSRNAELLLFPNFNMLPLNAFSRLSLKNLIFKAYFWKFNEIKN